jgi:hypothetical protein
MPDRSEDDAREVVAGVKLAVEPYRAQVELWPKTGRHILAQFDETSVVVYQAYNRTIGEFAAKNGFFGGEFGYGRMSWIKPNFLWMVFRSGWGTKENQEVTLAVRLKRDAFDAILSRAVASTFGGVAGVFATESEWKAAVARSDVRLQWDPDHDPSGAPLERRAIQLGLRGDTLRRYGREWILGIEDVSDFVREQRAHVEARAYDRLVTPRERVYSVTNEAAVRIGVERASPTV